MIFFFRQQTLLSDIAFTYTLLQYRALDSPFHDYTTSTPIIVASITSSACKVAPAPLLIFVIFFCLTSATICLSTHG